MDKIEVTEFHHPPTILFHDPIPKRHPKFHLIYIKRWAKDVEMITQKRLVQFIG